MCAARWIPIAGMPGTYCIYLQVLLVAFVWVGGCVAIGYDISPRIQLARVQLPRIHLARVQLPLIQLARVQDQRSSNSTSENNDTQIRRRCHDFVNENMWGASPPTPSE